MICYYLSRCGTKDNNYKSIEIRPRSFHIFIDITLSRLCANRTQGKRYNITLTYMYVLIQNQTRRSPNVCRSSANTLYARVAWASDAPMIYRTRFARENSHGTASRVDLRNDRRMSTPYRDRVRDFSVWVCVSVRSTIQYYHLIPHGNAVCVCGRKYV